MYDPMSILNMALVSIRLTLALNSGISKIAPKIRIRIPICLNTIPQLLGSWKPYVGALVSIRLSVARIRSTQPWLITALSLSAPSPKVSGMHRLLGPAALHRPLYQYIIV